MRTGILQALAMLLIGSMALAEPGDFKRVGVFKDARSHITDGMLKTLEDAQYVVEIIARRDLNDGEKLQRLDVLFLPGGWNSLNFAGFHGRRNMVDFVAQGKGILAGAFRSGYVRTANRPLFPQIGAVYNRVNGSGLFPCADSPLTAGIAGPFYLSAWDHMVVQPGPMGRTFLTDSSGLPVGVYGEIYGGRYIAIGCFFSGADAPGPERTLLLNCLAWLASAPSLTESAMAETRRMAELEFLRREKIYDYTLNERGPDHGAGIIPAAKNRLESALLSRLFRLDYILPHCPEAAKERVASMRQELEQAQAVLARNYEEAQAEKINTVKAMPRAELTADNPFFRKAEVLEMIAAMPDKTVDEKKAVEKVIAAMDNNAWMDTAPRATAAFLYGDQIQARLFAPAQFQALLGRADTLLAELEPSAATARDAQYAAEYADDLELLSGLLKDCAAKDASIRRQAAQELGRIGDRRAEKTLIGLLDDSDSHVRTQAILALGWMQSQAAVPALIRAANSPECWMRRRAAQALGQIGDPVAVETLLQLMNDEDSFVRENAILALGWLKAKEAVPGLLAIISQSDRQDPLQRGLMTAAIAALGHIGDERALAQLEHLAQTADDFPAPRYGGGRIKNIYSTSQYLGLQGHAELAIAEIKAGGRAAIGVSQAGFLSRREIFYGLTRHFNFFAGRPFPTLEANFPGDLAAAFPWLRAAGVTGIHNAWGSPDSDPEQYRQLIQRAGEYGLRWIDVMPQIGNIFGGRVPYTVNSQERTVNKPGAELVLFKFADLPAFQGFWTEEDYPNVEMESADLENHLQGKYGADYRCILGVTNAAAQLLPPRGQRLPENFYNRRVYAEFLELAGEMLLVYWREAQEWLHGMRKGCAFAFNNTTGVRFTYPGVAGRAGGVIDAHGPETYQSFGTDNAFMMELNKDGEARPALSEFYNWYSPSSEHAARGFAQHLMHGECFFNFALEHIFAHPANAALWSWDARRWDKVVEIFTKAQKLREYLAVPESAANVALVAGERSNLILYAKDYGERVARSRRYYQHQSGVWSALQQSQISCDAIWLETMTPEKLRRYRVLLLLDAKILMPQEAELIRQWVADGGVLIAGGATGLFNQWGELQENYALNDVFGVDYAGQAVPDPAANDTWCWDAGRPPFPAVNGELLPDNFRYHVLRDIKPVKSIGVYRVEDDAFLAGVGRGMVCEYDLPLGCDHIQTNTAQILARFADRAPALTVNQFGKGLCYFWAPIYPGLCYVASGWEMEANFKDFWPGVRELLAYMVHGGLRYAGAQLPATASTCPKDVEITVRRQPEHRRWMIHLLNLDPNLSLVRGVSLTIGADMLPTDGNIKLSYPDDAQIIHYNRSGGSLVFTARDFEAHDMILLEY